MRNKEMLRKARNTKLSNKLEWASETYFNG